MTAPCPATRRAPNLYSLPTLACQFPTQTLELMHQQVVWDVQTPRSTVPHHLPTLQQVRHACALTQISLDLRSLLDTQTPVPTTAPQHRPTLRQALPSCRTTRTTILRHVHLHLSVFAATPGILPPPHTQQQALQLCVLARTKLSPDPQSDLTLWASTLPGLLCSQREPTILGLQVISNRFAEVLTARKIKTTPIILSTHGHSDESTRTGGEMCLLTGILSIRPRRLGDGAE